MSATYSIGVDLGGTGLRIASYTTGDNFLDTITLPTRLAAGRDQVVRDMCEAVQALSHKDYGGRRLVGIGIGSPGPLELPEGILRSPPNLDNWDGFNLRQAIESALGREIEIENDANLAALAEQKVGAGKAYGVDTLAVLTLGTGVGTGLIFDGNIWHGVTGMGGEAGHIIVQNDEGVPCGCGGFGCLEQYASATAIARMARERMGSDAPANAKELARMAQSGNAEALAVFETVGRMLAIGLTSLINTLNLPLYLLGGGVCEAWSLFAPSMFSELLRRSYIYRLTAPAERDPIRFEHHKTYIQQAQLGAKAGLLGACLLPYREPSCSSASSGGQFGHQ